MAKPNPEKRHMSPEAKEASRQRMARFWQEVREGKRESPQAAKVRKQGAGNSPANGTLAGVVRSSYPVAPPPVPSNVQMPNISLPTSGPRTAESSPAIISLFKSGTVYVLRISDTRYNSLAAAIGREIKDGTGIVVVTPTDTRMFELKAGTHDRPSAPPRNPQAAPAPPVEDEQGAQGDEFASDPQQEAAQLAGEAEAQAREAGAGSLEDLQQELDNADTPAQRRTALKAIRQQSAPAAPNSACGRCRGVGQVMVALESGGAVPQVCPVCRGNGEITRFGVRG